MIVVKMIGGLGNQMFQYAAGLSASHRLGSQLIIDNGESKNDRTHSYSLSVFNINAGIMEKNVLPEIDREGRGNTNVLSYYKAEKFNYDKKFEKIKNNTYIEGFFQSEKFFKGVEAQIKKDFTLKNPAEGRNEEMLHKIRNCEAVSLHIRRGDYFDNWKNRIFHGVNLSVYYKKAVKFINKRFKNPVFFIFSDDPQWVRENFKGIKESVVVDINDSKNGHEDLRLMSSCKHNIIANSTFSWWAAWLNDNKNKIITAPKKWFNNPFINISDLIPKEWVKL